jgi:hypothetical protein
MQNEQNQNCKTQTKVELQIIPNTNQTENNDCAGTIMLSVTCDGSKLTKADAGRFNEISEEVWVTLKSTKADAGRMPDIDLSIHEKCGSKLTKADSGLV